MLQVVAILDGSAIEVFLESAETATDADLLQSVGATFDAFLDIHEDESVPPVHFVNNKS